MDGPTDGPMDGPTDGPTDWWTDRWMMNDLQMNDWVSNITKNMIKDLEKYDSFFAFTTSICQERGGQTEEKWMKLLDSQSKHFHDWLADVVKKSKMMLSVNRNFQKKC